MEHIFNKKSEQSKRTLLLLHGTGGSERDLIPIAETIDDEANVLSVRGNVLENGMARYFKRLSEGVFDEADLIYRTKELNAFLDEAAAKYEFDRNNIIAIGYSNGANIAASLLFHFESALSGAILHHPMVPLRNIQLPNLTRKNIFIAAGENDPLCPAAESLELQSLLEGAQAKVTIHWENNGHQLTMSEVEAAKQWYNKLYN